MKKKKEEEEEEEEEAEEGLAGTARRLHGGHKNTHNIYLAD